VVLFGNIKVAKIRFSREVVKGEIRNTIDVKAEVKIYKEQGIGIGNLELGSTRRELQTGNCKQ